MTHDANVQICDEWGDDNPHAGLTYEEEMSWWEAHREG